MTHFAFGLINSVSGYAITAAALSAGGSANYMSRTFGAPTDGKKWTISFWILKNKNGLNTAADHVVFSAIDTQRDQVGFGFNSPDNLYCTANSGLVISDTNAVFRDPNWEHVCIRRDSTQVAASDRTIMEVNGVALSKLTDTAVALNEITAFNSAVVHEIWRIVSANIFGLDCYLAEFNFIDGQALGPTSFGEFNNGNWEPIEVAIADYGNNGFYLGEDIATGGDSSGKGNNWAVNGGVTAVTNTPTDVKATWNPLGVNGTTTHGTYSEGNTRFDANNSNRSGPMTTLGISAGEQKYWEILNNGSANGNAGYGIAENGADLSGNVVATKCVTYNQNGNKTVSAATSAFGDSYTSTEVLGFEFDYDAQTLECFNEGVSQGSISTVSLTDAVLFPCIAVNSIINGTLVDEADWSRTPTAGFTALSVANMEPNAITSGTSIVGYNPTGGTPSNISGPTVTAIYATGFIASNAVAYTCDVDNPIGGTVMPRGQAN